MPRTLVRVGSEIPLLDLRSFGRRGPDGRLHLSPAFLEQIVRTASRAPEVMVKVSGGANSTRGAIAHLKYIDRQGKLELQTDEGQRTKGKGGEAGLVADWDPGSRAGEGPWTLSPHGGPEAGEARAQRNSLYAEGDLSSEAAIREPGLRAGTTCPQASLRPGSARGPGPSARTPRHQGGERAGGAAQYSKSHTARLARTVRTALARPRDRCQCDGARG